MPWKSTTDEMILQEYGKIADTLNWSSQRFDKTQLGSLAYHKLYSRVGGLSDADVQEVAFQEASQVILSPKNWSSEFSVLENKYATTEILKLMERFSDPVQFVVFLAKNIDWTPFKSFDGGYTEDWQPETDPSLFSWLELELTSSIYLRYFRRLSYPKFMLDMYNTMQADGWFLSHHDKRSEVSDDLEQLCRDHCREMLSVKFPKFPDLLCFAIAETPEALGVQHIIKQISTFVVAYRISLLKNMRARHASAVELLKFYCSQGPVSSSDLKDTLFFLLTRRFYIDDELIRHLEQHTPDDMKCDSTLTLSHDMAFTLTQYLDNKSVIAFASTCKRVKSLVEVSGNGHWLVACKRRFGHLPLPVKLPSGFLWYDVYQYMNLVMETYDQHHRRIPYGLAKFIKKKRNIKRLPNGEPDNLNVFETARKAGEISYERESKIIIWSPKD